VNCKRTLLVLVGASYPALAHASLLYPEEIEKQYGVYPECTVCHENNTGGEGTVREPFGRQVADHGASGDDIPSLLNALAQMDAEGRASDADQDGWGDIEELRQQTDPNDFYDPPSGPPTSATSGSGGSGTETLTSGGAGSNNDSGGSGGAGETGPETATTGRTRPRPPPNAELPPELETGCRIGAVSQDRTPWIPPALLLGAVFVRRRPAHTRREH
jgi:hypothetical protein